MSDKTLEELRIAYEWFGNCGAKNSAATVATLYCDSKGKKVGA